VKSKTTNQGLTVTSHVGRDLLASAAVFKTEAAATWEYVVNSLQYVDKGVSPVVSVDVNTRKRTITVADNGRGMTSADLSHYFTMHAENRDRRAGRPGRGKFGTGKAAAFGIGSLLRIDTVRNALRNVVELARASVDASDGSEIPLNWLVQNEQTTAPNGTIVYIGEVNLPRLEVAPIVEYIERHLAVFRASNPSVAVNTHVCEYREPRILGTRSFRPSAKQAAVIGDVELIVKTAQAPLAEAEQGVYVTAGPGNLVAVERAGIDRKEFGAYLFGEVDCRALESYPTPIEPYDMSRSLQLNPKHPVVAVLVGFIGSKLEEVRSDIATEHQKARQTEQARRLAAESARIAEVLNNDFRDQQRRLTDIRTVASRQGAATTLFGEGAPGADEPDSWVEGFDKPGVVPKSKTGHREGDGTGRDTPKIKRTGEHSDEGNDSVSPAGGDGKRRARPRGGFQVDYQNLGPEEDRSRYEPKSMTILINLDHPVVSAALGSGAVEDPVFRRLSYEIAFSEYAIALAYEMAQVDPEIPADDLLYDVRASLNRIARAAVRLYQD
jgi:hypothetical protein